MCEQGSACLTAELPTLHHDARLATVQSVYVSSRTGLAMREGATVLDPITFEILRHRLWTINDEQGKIAARISGSPIVYDVKDFSASLLTPTGDSLFIGPHVTRLSIALHRITKSVLALFGE